MRYELSDGNIIVADEAFMRANYPEGGYRQVPEVERSETAPTIICVGGFFDRFGDQKIPVLASADPVVQAIVRDASVRQYITLTRPDLEQALDILISKGFAIDKARVLSPIISEEERP